MQLDGARTNFQQLGFSRVSQLLRGPLLQSVPGFDSVAGRPFSDEQLKICRECLVVELGS